MADFDVAYAREAMARAHAVAEDPQAPALYQAAKQAGDDIADPEDRKIFLGDLNSGSWGAFQPDTGET